MNEKRIRKLRMKFLSISFISLMLAMIAVTGLILGSNHLISRRNIKSVLQYIVDNEGDLPGARDIGENYTGTVNHDRSVVRFLHEIFDPQIAMGDTMNPEFFFSNRYFAIIYDENLYIESVITNHTAVVSEDEAAAYGELALEKSSRYGRYSDYYYQVGDTSDGGKIVVYLDSSNLINTNTRLLYVTIVIILLGMIIAAVFTMHFSKWAIAPEIHAMETQERFITNASHELKTPLAVIRANTEMTEMLGGETEWTRSTVKQVDKMSALIQNLVMIARAEESVQDTIFEDCDITAAVSDTVKDFEPIAVNEGKELTHELEADVHVRASDPHIRQLASLLIDNAIKYCDDGGKIDVELMRSGKSARLVVSNDYSDGENMDFTRFFERFYRADESHSQEKSGYGIGLSIAENIVKIYKGTIHASWSEGRISFTCEFKF